MKGMTSDKPKPFIECNGTPMIINTLNQLDRHGIQDVVIVVGYKKEYFFEHLGNSYKHISISYVVVDEWEQVNNMYSLHRALLHLEEAQDALFLLEADLILSSEAFDSIMHSQEENFAVVGTYTGEITGSVVGLKEAVIDKLYLKKHQSEDFLYDDKYKTVNIWKFSKQNTQRLRIEIAHFLETYGNNDYYEAVFNSLFSSERIPVIHLDHPWYEVDTPEDLQTAKMLFLSPQQQLQSNIF